MVICTHYAGNNPVKYTDPDGRVAWDSSNEWSEEYIDKYSKYVNSKIEEYQSNGMKFTCEDLSLSLVIDFASENGLPVSIQNGTGTYSSNDASFSSSKQFKNKVLSTTGAADLVNNTVGIKVNDMKAGDLICMDTGIPNESKDQNYSHIQVASIVLGSCIGIRQGNITSGSSKYNSPFYGGEHITNRVYDYKSDNFMNFTSNISVPSAKTSFSMSFRRWDFGGMK